MNPGDPVAQSRTAQKALLDVCFSAATEGHDHGYSDFIKGALTRLDTVMRLGDEKWEVARILKLMSGDASHARFDAAALERAQASVSSVSRGDITLKA